MEPIHELVRMCEVSNEVEAAMVVNLLRDEGIPAQSDSSQATAAFGGLPFEPGHAIFVPSSMAAKAREILVKYPHFQDLRNVNELG